ncbi:MAG: alternative ribosome rescue aminoacyl-tRNA hydrolase ArfB [Myxococcota bacterium]
MDDLEVRPGLTIPADELTFTTSRSGGPGGQHVNTTSTKVTVRFDVGNSSVGEPWVSRWKERLASRLTSAGELVLHSDRYRSQSRNKDDVRERLAATLKAALVVQKPRRDTRPTRGSQRRRIEKKKSRGQTKALRGRVRED